MKDGNKKVLDGYLFDVKITTILDAPNFLHS